MQLSKSEVVKGIANWFIWLYTISDASMQNRARLSTDEARTTAATIIFDNLEDESEETDGASLRKIFKIEAQTGSPKPVLQDPFCPASPDSSQPEFGEAPLPDNQGERQNRVDNPMQSGEHLLLNSFSAYQGLRQA